MKILVVGGGGREHALAWRLSKSPQVRQVFASPGNPGSAQVATCLPAPEQVSGYADLAERYGIDLTVVGPEAPLVAGIVDRFRARGLAIIGPTQAAARLEGSKIFAKQFFERAGIPTARSVQTSSLSEAQQALKRFSLPVVIKADGLAAGKGVTIAVTPEEAQDAVRILGPQLVIEEYLTGEEVSFIGVSDGEAVYPFAPTQDHKRIFDGDQGPNTGGMGAYCDSRILSDSQTAEIMDKVMLPAVWTMKEEGTPFTGFLFAGLMMTAEGPRTLEFNVRMGDPETQAILCSFEGDLAEVLRAGGPIPFSRPSVCLVAAARGYPEQPIVGDEISGVAAAESTGARVFHAGTKQRDGKVVTSGGRVLGVTATADTLPAAIDAAYRGMKEIHFEGMQVRQDIGRKGLQRW